MDNWVESVEREDFIEVEEESFGTFIFIAPRPRRGAEFVLEGQSEQSPLPVIGVSARAKRKAVSPPPGSEEMRKGGGSPSMMVEDIYQDTWLEDWEVKNKIYFIILLNG